MSYCRTTSDGVVLSNLYERCLASRDFPCYTPPRDGSTLSLSMAHEFARGAPSSYKLLAAKRRRKVTQPTHPSPRDRTALPPTLPPDTRHSPPRFPTIFFSASPNLRRDFYGHGRRKPSSHFEGVLARSQEDDGDDAYLSHAEGLPHPHRSGGFPILAGRRYTSGRESFFTMSNTSSIVSSRPRTDDFANFDFDRKRRLFQEGAIFARNV